MIEKFRFYICWVLRYLFIFSLTVNIVGGKSYTAFLLSIAFFATFYDFIVEKIFRIKLSEIVKVFVTLFIFISLYLGTYLDFYGVFLWWDSMLHLLSGILFFVIGITIYEKILKEKNKIATAFFGFCFSLSTTVIWEIFEFIIDSTMGQNMQRALNEFGRNAIMDTMIDMIYGTVGTIIAVMIFTIFANRKK